jgi:lipopolysaccharide biosynthesis regulator YciM
VPEPPQTPAPAVEPDTSQPAEPEAQPEPQTRRSSPQTNSTSDMLDYSRQRNEQAQEAERQRRANLSQRDALSEASRVIDSAIRGKEDLVLQNPDAASRVIERLQQLYPQLSSEQLQRAVQTRAELGTQGRR